MKGEGRRKKQLLDDLRNRRRYWELKEGAEDRKSANESSSQDTLCHKEGIQVHRLVIIIIIIIIIIKYVAYSSQGSYTGQLDFATDWQILVRRDCLISITLRQVC